MTPDPYHDALAAAAKARRAAAMPLAARSPRALAALVLIVYGAGVWFACPKASAQGNQPAATLTVSREIPLTPGAESPLEIRLGPGDAVPPKSVLIIRDVPPGMSLSEGRAFGTGVWVLPASLVKSLKLRAPADARSSILTVVLATPDGTSLAEAKIALVTAPHKSDEQTAKTA